MSQRAIVLSMLKRAKSKGITVFDAHQKGIYRLAARIMELRDQGNVIETIREPHANGTHARYRLVRPA